MFYTYNTSAFIPQDLLNDIFPSSSSIWWRRFRLKTLYDVLPCPCSSAVPFGKQMGVAHRWKGLSLDVSAVALAGRQWWLEVCRQRFPDWPCAFKHCALDVFSSQPYHCHSSFVFFWHFHLQTVRDRIIWRRCRPQTEFRSCCFGAVLRGAVLYNMCCEFMVCVSCPMRCLGQRYKTLTRQSRQWWKPEHGFPVRRLRRRSRTKWNVMRMRLTYTVNSRSRCLCHQLLC